MFQLKEDEAMREVREWKRECNESVAHLSRREALRTRLADSLANTRGMGLLDPAKRNRRLPQQWRAEELLKSLEIDSSISGIQGQVKN